MHWLWGFSHQIKSGLPGVGAYLQCKCGQSWLHSCWFPFTRAHGEGEPKSPLIAWVNWALFESKELMIPGGSSKERWGQEAPPGSVWVPMDLVFLLWWCLADLGLGRKLRGLTISSAGNPWSWGALSDGLCTVCAVLAPLWAADSCVTGCPVCMQTIPLPCRGGREFSPWWLNFKIAKQMGFVLIEVIALFQMLSQKRCFMQS